MAGRRTTDPVPVMLFLTVFTAEANRSWPAALQFHPICDLKPVTEYA